MSEIKSILKRYQVAVDTEPGRATHILSEIRGNRFYIAFNRPTRYNAFTTAMYDIFMDLILRANQNPEVKFIIVSGSGGNYSSGNDLANFTNPHYQGIAQTEEMARASAAGLELFCQSIITSKKPIFAIVQGKVIGFAFTQLALYDRVFAVDGAQFNAPLVQLAQGPEMCASYTFPQRFGRNIGEDLIVKGTKVSTAFLQSHGFLTSYQNRKAAQEALNKHLSELDQLQWNSYLSTRQLFRDTERQTLLKVNEKECANLAKRWSCPNLPNHLIEYMKRVKAKPKL